MDSTRIDSLQQQTFLAAFLNSCILKAYIIGLTMELHKYKAENVR